MKMCVFTMSEGLYFQDQFAIPKLQAHLPKNIPQYCQSCWKTGFTFEPMCTYAGQVVHSRSKNVPDQPSCRMLCADVENCQVAIFNQHNGNCVLRSEYIGNNGGCYISGNDRIFSARKCDVVPACKYPNGKVTFTMPPTILPIMTTASSVMATANHKKTDIYKGKTFLGFFHFF